MNSQQLSKGESAIYDRQLRLWGSSAQMRIKSSTVAVFGLTPSTVEVVKNLILAGSSLILQDDRPVTDETSNFLIRLEVDQTSGMSVAETTAIAVHRLNEHPSVLAKSEQFILRDISSLVVSFSFLKYNISEAVRLSALARSLNASFFLLIDSSTICWSFSDFGKLHVVEDFTPPLKRDERTGHRATLVRSEEYDFVDFAQFLDSTKIAPQFPRKTLVEFQFVFFWLRYLNSNMTDDLSPEFERIESGLSQSCEPHFAAIQGALVAQEVIKFITKRDPPLVNSLLVSIQDCSCVVLKQPGYLDKRIRKEQTTEEEVEVVETDICL